MPVTDTVAFELSTRDRKRLAARLAASNDAPPVALRTAAGTDIELPAPARQAVKQLLAELAAGNAVHVLADEHDLTTQEVAGLLGLSRTFGVRLIDNGTLPAHHAGTHYAVAARAQADPFRDCAPSRSQSDQAHNFWGDHLLRRGSRAPERSGVRTVIGEPCQ